MRQYILKIIKNTIKHKIMIGEDKLKHVVVSAIITVVLNLFLPWWAAALIILAIGISKEVYDKTTNKGCAEWEDLLADVIGIIIGIL